MMMRAITLIALLAATRHVAGYRMQPPDKKLTTIHQPPKIQTAPPVAQGPFTPWPEPLVQAHGDYRDEAFLEQHIGGPLYSKQTELPRLPIPSLEETISRFLPTALPLAQDEQEAKSLLEDSRTFPEQAKVLQERLLQRKEDSSDSSWLQDLWQTLGYLQVRNSLIQVSYFLFVPDDATLPKEKASIARATALLVAMAQSRKQVCSGNMPYETIPHRDGEEEPLCSTGFKYLFHSCRIPTAQQDAYHLYDPSLHQHCVVACKGQFFAVDFCDQQGEPLPLAVLEHRLQRCVKLAQEQANLPQLGWLTSTDRDFWADSRQQLLQVGGSTMKEALAKLESGAFVLNLDADEPESMTDAGNVFWHGGEKSGGNRWFDKSLQLVCTKNGRVAYVGEHSMLDAAPTIPLIRRIMKTTYKKLSRKQKEPPQEEANNDDGVSNIFADCWSSSPELAATASDLTSIAQQHHKQLTSEYELQVKVFEEFGKKFIKTAGFICHDFAQMAMQLAAYRLFGQQVGTYEAALTRPFLHGRTETARPVSPESQAFVKCMGLKPNNEDPEKKLSLLKKAAEVHDEYQRAASSGLGVDRHFFGLSQMVKEGETVPSMLENPLFARSKNWRLCTSSVIFGPGFGPGTDDGVGVGYRVEANAMYFTCTSRRANEYLQPFGELLEEALLEMRDLVNANEESANGEPNE